MSLTITNRSAQTFRLNGAFPAPTGSTVSPANGDAFPADPTTILPGASATWGAAASSNVLGLLGVFGLTTDAVANAFNAARNPFFPALERADFHEQLMADEAPIQLRKQRGRPFEKGRSGNPKGRTPGTRCKATVMAERLADDAAEGIVNKTIELAMMGDTTALGLYLKHFLPPRKGRPIAVSPPLINSAADVPQAIAAIMALVAAGEVSPADALDLTALAEASRKAIETDILAKRVAALEGDDVSI